MTVTEWEGQVLLTCVSEWFLVKPSSNSGIARQLRTQLTMARPTMVHCVSKSGLLRNWVVWVHSTRAPSCVLVWLHY